MAQNHLNFENTVNLGSFYTPKFVVEIAYKMLEKVANLKEFLLFDSSCGYGDFFLLNLNYLGADIDGEAVKKVGANIKTIRTNSLFGVSREKFGISSDERLIIIGNPPYNDKTSIIRNGIKKSLFEVDVNLSHRDSGISFLRSYAVLKPEFVCVLHPLSYLIKESNFKALNDFRKDYRLIDALVISSEIFTPKSSTFFPIIISLYEKNSLGMDFGFIRNFEFKTYEKYKFKLNDFDFITNYVRKYPNPSDNRKEVAFFHTLRDINALKRNQTFQPKQTANSIKVFADNLKYYCYIDHFKRFANLLPYYFGNLDIFINNAEFLKISDEFLELKRKPIIEKYFENLFRGNIRCI